MKTTSTKNKLSTCLLFLAVIMFFTIPQLSWAQGMEEDLDARNEWDMMRLMDPNSQTIPKHIRQKELAFVKTISTQRNKDGNSFYSNIGPWNVGGRTRALALDIRNENIILAGGVSGGIWRSEDGGANWKLITSPLEPFNVTTITQDTRSGKEGIWYAGTGELLGGSASNNAAYYYGSGLLKSIDNGKSWTILQSTTSANTNSFDLVWDFIWNTCVKAKDTANSVFAATYGTIYKSVDGGKKWTRALGGGGNSGSEYSRFTDVVSDANGVLYASLSSDGWQAGIYRSTDGKKWTLISNGLLPKTHQRMSIGIDPNDPNRVYFIAETPQFGKRTTDFRGTEAFHTLLKYEYKSGDGSGSEGTWTDLSNNIPATGGAFGNFYSQSGYDLFVRVMPGDPNTIFLGGTNLWRSTDGFTSTNNTSWIAGYGVNTTMPNYQLYPNQHPDQHTLIFLSSNPKTAFSGCDGGVFKTNNITEKNVSWTSLNNGYLTTQFYSVAIDHSLPGSDLIIGGLQDNGTFWNNSSNPKSTWVMPGNGDGSFGYITAGAGFYYLSKQQGKIGRYILDNAGNMLQMARIDPDSASQNDYLFIHPFAVNPHNEKELFLPSKSKVWRNKDVTQIPLHNQLDSVAVNIGWEILEQTQDTNEFWAAIAISNAPANILIVGSTKGRLIKINDCEANNPQVQDITSSEFPKGGFINDIVIDPINADRFMVIFSNYKVKSVFYTIDGGLNFTDVSANLEQNADGSGNGPSCRTGGIMTLENNTRAFFIGTSAGLYATDTLIGNQTNWVLQAPDELGYSVVNDLDYRNSDGQLYIATHGIGMWKATFTQRNQILALNKIPSLDFQISPNPATNYVQITLPVTLEKGLIKILDERGRIISEQNIQSNIFTMPIPQMASGIYYIDISDKVYNFRKSIFIK